MRRLLALMLDLRFPCRLGRFQATLLLHVRLVPCTLLNHLQSLDGKHLLGNCMHQRGIFCPLPGPFFAGGRCQAVATALAAGCTVVAIAKGAAWVYMSPPLPCPNTPALKGGFKCSKPHIIVLGNCRLFSLFVSRSDAFPAKCSETGGFLSFGTVQRFWGQEAQKWAKKGPKMHRYKNGPKRPEIAPATARNSLCF